MKIAAFSIADYCEGTDGMPHDVERLYFRMLLKMYSREGGLPDDDATNARMFGYADVRTYKSLKAKLLRWPGALYLDGDLLRNDRAEAQISDVKKRLAEARKNGAIGGRSKRDRREIGARSTEDRPEIDYRSSSDHQSIPHATTGKNSDLGQASPSPKPSPSPEPRSEESKTPLELDAARSGAFQTGLREAQPRRPAVLPKFVSEDALAKARRRYPGWDAQTFLHEFNNSGLLKTARDPDAAFLGFMKSRTQGRDPYGEPYPERETSGATT